MKHRSLYIIMCIFSLLAFISCRDEEAVQSAEGKRTVIVNLGIAMSRVALEGTPETSYGAASNMKVWIFDEEGKPIEGGYASVDNPPFSVKDLQGKLVETVTMDFDVTDATELQLRVLLNSNLVDISYEENRLTLDENTTMNELDNATFTLKEDVTLGDNTVPMYGKSDKNITLDNKRNYDISIDVERCIGKLELFFTRENKNSPLTINSIKLDHVPDKGYLDVPVSYALTYRDPIDLLLEKTGIDAVLTTDRASTTGNFSEIYEQDNTTFQRLELEQSYLLENPNGDTWTAIAENHDYVYQEEGEIKDKETRYVMTVNYTLGTNPAADQAIYLPKIVRNEWNKIFVRVTDKGELEIRYKALPWNKVESSIGYAPQSASTTDNPFDTDTEYEEFIKNGSYILLPVGEFKNKKIDDVPETYWDRTSVQKLFRLLYDYPADQGDDDARYCILTKPTYDLNDSSHKTLKEGTAGARYFFMLTGPKGATWKAKLLNEDGIESTDFEFSYTPEDDFSGSEYEGDGEVNKVSHGIAREKPYIIQVNCVEAWTKGTSFTNRTDWGTQKDEEKKLVQTRLYITVTLTDGLTYNLDINPAYDKNSKLEFLYEYEDKYRRYAGEDDFVWIRQVPAQSGWSYEDLASPEKNEHQDQKYWWQVNKYWK